MKENEFVGWAVRGPLWPRRLELMLAQLAYVVAQGNSKDKLNLRDFDIFDPRRKENKELDQHAEMFAGAFTAGVRRLKSKRRIG